jgi:hypothetical protein
MAKGLTDAQLDAMDEMEARQNLYGTAARVLESPDAAPMTDAQMNQRATSDSVMQATPFGQATMPQSAPQPPQADFREPPKPLTDAELNAQEDNLYYDPSYEMPFEEFAPVHARRQQEKNTVGSFVDGAVAAGQGLVSLTAEMGGELRDNFTSNLFRPDRFATQNFVTLKEAGRKAGLEFAKLVDWIGNTARDHATDVRRQEQVRSVIAQKLQAEGKLSGDLRGDIEIINREFAAAKERGETAPTPLEENADVEQAFEDYRRGKNFDREIAGVGNFSIGQTPVTQESSEARATNPFTGEVMEPQRALATGGAMAFAPDNLLPVGAGVMSKVRILRRLSSITGVPLKMTENVANAGADALQRGAMRITDKVQDLTGMNAMQQTAAATALTGGVGYLSTQGQGAPAALGGVATGVLSILPIMKFGGAILRRTGATAGGGYAIVREMGAGGAGAAGAEAAEAMAKSGVFPQRYARHMQPGGASADSTLRRVAQDPENPQMLRRLSRTANNLGATQAFRLTDDVVSSAAVSGLAAAPFALVAPDAEQGGQIVGGALMLGTLAGTATRTFGRRPAEVDADIARMLVDVTESNGDAASLMSLSHDSLSQLAAMQGVLRNKVKFIPLRGQDYRANADLRAAGGETAAGLYIEKDANGSARIFVNMGHTAPMDGKVSVRPDADKGGNVIDITAADGTVDSTHVPQGIRLLVKTGDAVSANQRLAQDLSPTRIVPHEIGHAILTSDILDGQPRNDLRNLVNQQYATDGVAARGREYATRLVDKDILVGAIEDAPVNLTDAQINDISSGKTTLADVLKGQPVSEQARQRLIDQRVEELSQRSIEKGQDPLDWARDEIIAETFASEAPAIDFRAIRRDALFPRLAESMLSAGGRVLEVMGARLDPGTGKLMDNPSVLFRDNPLFQDRIMQKRVREYVRSYDQYLAGLEEAGAKELRGVELARSSKPEDLARSTHVKLRDEGNGVLENDFMVQRPDGTYTMKAQKTVNLTENARSAQIKTLYDARKFVPVNSQEFGKRKVNGREVVGGPVLPKQFDFFTNFPKYLRPDPTTGDIGLVRKIEASREDGGSWDIDVNVIGTGSSGRYRVINLGNTRAVQRETVPYGWIISKANHLLAASLDLNSFRGSAMKAINKGDLGLFNNDMRQVEADLKTYLANHRNGRPGEMTIGQQKRDMLNGLIGTGTAVQRTANPLYSDLNPRGSIRTWRVDRLNDAKPTGRTGYFFDYDKINNNRMPSALPQTGMAMPDTPANLSTDQILRELEENQGYLGLSTLGMREGRPVKGGAQQTRELLKRNTALNEELKRRGGPQEESDVARVLRQRGQAMPDVDVQWETYAENLRDDVESWSPARDTGKIDYEMQDVVDSFVDFARTNPQLAGGELTAAFYRAEKPTASQRKKLNAAIANVGEPPRTATGGTRGQAMPDGPVRGERADIPLNPRARQAAFISDRGEVRATGRATHFETNEDLGPDFLAIGAGHLGEDGFFRFGSQSMDEAMGDSPATSSAAAARYNQSVYDQGQRPSSMLEEPPGLERPTAAESPAADAVGLKSAKFLESAVGDGMENLRQRQARRPGTGVAKNDLVRFHTNDGKPIYIGAVKKDGGKSFKGWVEETEAWLPPEQTQQFRQWYKELYGHFTKIFGDRAGEMMMAWLAAQQNVSPGGALKNVFRVEDRIAGIGTGKKGGLADAKIEGVLRDVVPEGGFGPKLSDFVDSGFQRETRTYMAGRPEGGRPFVADVHTGRDSGHVDQQTLSRLKELSDEGNLFIDGAPATVKVTKTKTVKRGEKTAVVPERIRVTPASGKSFFVDVDMRGSPGSTQYEGISVWGNSMTDYLNSTQWAGGNWTPAEVQAVGWMRTLRQYGLPESTVESALQQNTARIFAEVNYSSGDLLPANFPGFETLRPDAQNAITIDVITQSVNELADIIGGSLRVQRISAGQGVWGKSRAPTTVIEVLGSPEATDLLGLGLATASEQAATMSATLGVGGKNSKVMTFRKADGSKFTDVEMQSLIDDAGLSGYTLQQLPGGDVGFVADSTADFRPKGFTEKRAAQFEQNIVDWAERSGVDLRVDTTPAQIKSYGNNWQNQKGGESYVSGLIERGGSSRVRDILRFRGRFAEILQDAIKRHAPEALAPDPAQQIAPIRQAAESPPAAVLEMLRAS